VDKVKIKGWGRDILDRGLGRKYAVYTYSEEMNSKSVRKFYDNIYE